MGQVNQHAPLPLCLQKPSMATVRKWRGALFPKLFFYGVCGLNFHSQFLPNHCFSGNHLVCMWRAPGAPPLSWLDPGHQNELLNFSFPTPKPGTTGDGIGAQAWKTAEGIPGPARLPREGIRSSLCPCCLRDPDLSGCHLLRIAALLMIVFSVSPTSV